MSLQGTRQRHRSGTAGALNDRSGHLMSAAPPRPRWMEDRTDLPCQQPHPDAALFAPDKDEPGSEDEATIAWRTGLRDRAVQLCGTCPMELDCREHGLRYHHFGIWGGVRQDSLLGPEKRRLLNELDRERRRRSA